MESVGPVLLRPGKVGSQQIADVIGALPIAPDRNAPRASGTLASHYAPDIPVALVPTDKLLPTLVRLENRGCQVALLHFSSLPAERKMALKEEIGLFCASEVYAHQLYASLRKLDKSGADVIVIEATPDTDVWKGVNDRLARAACNGQGIIERLLESS